MDSKKSTNLTASKIIRWAGISSIVTGAIFVAIQPIHPPDELSSVGVGSWGAITSLKTVMSLFGIFAVTGLYARHSKHVGLGGFLGYVFLTSFYAVQMCYSFAEAFILPYLTKDAPTYIESVLGLVNGKGSTIPLGALATIMSLVSVLYLLGTFLLGFAMYRAKIMPKTASLLLAFSGPIAIVMVTVLPHHLERYAAFPMGIALVWLGYSLFIEKRK